MCRGLGHRPLSKALSEGRQAVTCAAPGTALKVQAAALFVDGWCILRTHRVSRVMDEGLSNQQAT